MDAGFSLERKPPVPCATSHAACHVRVWSISHVIYICGIGVYADVGLYVALQSRTSWSCVVCGCGCCEATCGVSAAPARAHSNSNSSRYGLDLGLGPAVTSVLCYISADLQLPGCPGFRFRQPAARSTGAPERGRGGARRRGGRKAHRPAASGQHLG
jgi:hypothetical protein